MDGLDPHREFKRQNQLVLTGLPDEPQEAAEQVVLELRKREKE